MKYRIKSKYKRYLDRLTASLLILVTLVQQFGGIFLSPVKPPQAQASTTTSVSSKTDWESGTSYGTDTELSPGNLEMGRNGTWTTTESLSATLRINSEGANTVSAGSFIYAVHGSSTIYFTRYDPGNDSWSYMADLPMISNHGADFAYDGDDTIYAFLGYNSTEFYKYTISTNSWTALANTPLSRSYGAALVYTDGAVYGTRGIGTASFWKYDVATNQWFVMANAAGANYSADLVYDGDDAIYYRRAAQQLNFNKYTISTNTWSNLASAPEVGGNNVQLGLMTYANGYVYSSQGTGLAGFYRYEVASNTWETLSSMPSTIGYGASISYHADDGYIYATRGLNSTTFWRYDITNNFWLPLASTPVGPYYGADMVYDGDDALFLRRGEQYLNFYKYTISTNTWSTMASLPGAGSVNVQSGGLTYANGYIYANQGNGASGFYRYEVASNTWETLSSTPSTIGYGASISYNAGDGYIYATRGLNTTAFWRYDIDANQWTTITSTPVIASEGSTILSDGSKIYFTSGNSTNYFYSYDPDTTTWAALTDYPDTINIGSDMAVLDGYIYATSGYSSAERYRYSISGNVWERVSNLPQIIHYGYTAVAVGSDIYSTRGWSTASFWKYTPANLYKTTAEYISATLDLTHVESWVDLTNSTTTPTGTSVTFSTRSSTDSYTWSDWEVVSGGAIASPVRRYLQVKIAMTSDGSVTPSVASFSVNYNGDATAPTNPSTVTAHDSVGQSEALVSGSSYSFTNPYFTWSGASDAETGVSGYYVYFGADQNADPTTDGVFQTTSTYTATNAFAPQTYYLRLKTKDVFGNVSSTAWSAFSYVYQGVATASTAQLDSQADWEAGTLTTLDTITNAGSLQLENQDGFWEHEVPRANIPGNVQTYENQNITKGNGNYLYVLRGTNLQNLYRYDMVANTWTSLAVPPATSQYGAAITYDGGDYLYVTQGSATTAFWRYQISTDTWEVLTNLPTGATYGSSLQFAQGAVYYFTSSFTWKYAPGTASWTQLENHSLGISRGASSVYDGADTIYLTQGNYFANFKKYSISQNTWTTLSSLPEGQYSGGSLAYGGADTLYATIGTYDSQRFYKYTISTDTWTQAPNLPVAIGEAASIVWDGSRYVYLVQGGGTLFYRYDTLKARWPSSTNAASLSLSRGSGSAFDGDDTLYVTRGNYFNHFAKYTFSTNTWTTLSDLPVGLYSGGSIVYAGEDTLYATVGSHDGRKFYKYTISTDTWIRAPDTPTTVGTSASLVWDGGQYVYWVQGGGTLFYRYDTQTEEWVSRASIPGSVTSYENQNITKGDGNYLYLLRGTNLQDFYRYNTETNTWSTMTQAPATTQYGTSITYDGGNYIYASRGIATRTFWRYQISTNTWEVMSDAPLGFAYGASLAYVNNMVYALHGNGTGFSRFIPESATTSFVSDGSFISDGIDFNGSVYKWSSLRVTRSLPAGTTLTAYTRTSSDNAAWTDWEVAPSVRTEGSIQHFRIVSTENSYMQVKLEFASSDNIYSPVVDQVDVYYYIDTTAPTAPTSATGLSAEGSATSLTTNTWYNYASPYFSWTGATDEEGSGVSGYYVYLGADEAATPSASGSFQAAAAYTPALSTDGTYYLRVQSRDAAGNVSDPVALFTYKYDGTNPTAPASVSSTTVGYSAESTFTFFWPAATDGESGLAGYEYKTGATTGDYSDWQFTTSTTVTGVPAYQSGQNIFYVRAKDNVGNYSTVTANTGTSSFYFNQDAPTAPTNLSMSPSTTSSSPSSTNSFTLTWDKPATYSGELAKYYYCVNCTPSASTMTETTAAETAARTLTSQPLATQQGRNTVYLVAEDNNVNSETGAGNRNFDAYATLDFYATTTAPGAPTSLTISDASDRANSSWRLTLAWVAASTGGTVSEYHIYRSTDNSTFTKIGVATSTAYTDADLTQSTTYYYKVLAIDDAGSTSIYSATVSKSPEGKYNAPPAAGGTPSAAAGSTTATITWTTGRDAFGTVEYGKTDEYGSAATETEAVTSHSVKLTGLSPGTTYHYRVLSLDDATLVGYERADAYSADYTFTTLATADISEMEVSDIDLDSAVVSWKTTSLATSRVEYGATTEYGSVVDVSTTAEESVHTARLTNLSHSTTYHFRVSGTTSDGTDIFSQDQTFITVTFPVVTAVIFNTDQGRGGTSATIAWSTNVPTSSEVEYQAVEIDAESSFFDTNLSELVVTTTVGKQVDLAALQTLSQTDLARLPVKPVADAASIYSGILETRRAQKITGLRDGAMYVFTLRGRDKHGNEAVSEPIRYVTGADTKPPLIENLVIETPIAGVGADAKAQIIITFETDEPAVAQAAWGPGVGSEYPQTTEKETEFTTRHVIVLRDLQPTTSYHLQIIAQDQNGNQIKTEDTVVVTPTAQQAAFDIILKNLEAVFGFLK